MNTIRELAKGYMRSLKSPNVTLIVAIILICLATIWPVAHKENASILVPVFLFACSGVMVLAALVDDYLDPSHRMLNPYERTPRNNALFIAAGDWPATDTRYHGGKVPQGTVLELLLTTDVVCVQLDEYLISELSKLTSVLPDTWYRLDHRANYKRGDWVLVIHGDPGLPAIGSDTKPLGELEALSKQPFWLELVIIDAPLAPHS